MIRLKIDVGSYNRFVSKARVSRGELLGLSPYFDDQLVLSPIDGIIERIERDPEGLAVLITIRRKEARWREAHSS